MTKDRALCAVHVGARDGGTNVCHREPVRSQAIRLCLNTNCRPLHACDIDLSDAADLSQLARNSRFNRIAERGRRHAARRHAQHRHGAVGRIDLSPRRWVWKVGRKPARNRIYRRLHLLRGDIDVPFELELDDDVGLAEGARRGHLCDAGDARERDLEGCGHG